jgi:hypothetical protein
MGIWWQGSLHIIMSIPQIFLGMFSMFCLTCMILVADMTACRLNFHECCGVSASNSEAVEWVPCVASVNGVYCS